MDAKRIKDINYSEGYDSREYGYSQGILITQPREVLYISGQVGIMKPNEQRDFAEQIDLAYENMEKVLMSANMTFDNVVKVTELVVGNSYERLETVNNKKKKVFRKFLPTSTYVPVASLALEGMLFEIEAVAVK